jgi:hypothetical protein
MTGTAASIVEFAFILLIPLVVVAGALAGLFAIGALFNALEHPEELRQRIEGAFRRPPKAPRDTAPDHYYRPFWKSSSVPRK